jgi:prefoldin subunit 5
VNQVEYTMLTSMISTVKHQIGALETVLATIANAKKESAKPKTLKPLDPLNDYLPAEVEDEIMVDLEKLRLQAQQGEQFFITKMQEVADGSSNPSPT